MKEPGRKVAETAGNGDTFLEVVCGFCERPVSIETLVAKVVCARKGKKKTKWNPRTRMHTRMQTQMANRAQA